MRRDVPLEEITCHGKVLSLHILSQILDGGRHLATQKYLVASNLPIQP